MHHNSYSLCSFLPVALALGTRIKRSEFFWCVKNEKERKGDRYLLENDN
jgi:hypothetical protein